jgi:hypothetical protein
MNLKGLCHEILFYLEAYKILKFGQNVSNLNSSLLFCGEHLPAYVKLHNNNEILQVILFRGREAAINDSENVYRKPPVILFLTNKSKAGYCM